MRPGTRLVAGVLVAVAIGGIAVAVGVALLLANTVDLRSSANANLRTADYLDATIDLERLVVDAETGLRGYVITGRPLFLAPQRAAARQLPQATAELNRAAASDGAFMTQAHTLGAAAHSYLTGYVPRVIGQVTADPAAARSYATTAEGKRLVDGIRSQTARLEGLISARQAARLRSARESANSAVTVGVIVLIVLTGLTLALGGVLGWLLVGRERARRRAEALYRASAQTASTLQQSLLPAHLPDVPSCELAIRFSPAGEGDLVGGDFYFPYALLEVGVEEARVTVACAGHPPAVLVSRDGEMMRVAACGDLLGVWPDIRLEEVEAPLRPGDGLLLYTDGVTDQGPGPDGSLEHALSRLAPDRSAETLADTLRAEAERSGGTPRDDVAIIALRYVPPAAQTDPLALTAGSAAA